MEPQTDIFNNEQVRIEWMDRTGLSRIREIDRSEHVNRAYSQRGTSLRSENVDWDVPPWDEQGEGEHSIAHQIAFCQGHVEKGALMLGAFAGHLLVGVGVLLPDLMEMTAQIPFLHTSRPYRRRGIASQLVEMLGKRARELGAERLYVSATPSQSAVGFYLSHGFQPTQEVHPELFALEPEDIHMIKAL